MTVVDTNVLLHLSVRGSPWHTAAKAAFSRERAAAPLAISRQILRELLSALTREQSWSRPMPVGEAAEVTTRIGAVFNIWEDGPAVWQQLLALGRQFTFGGKQVHDANIVAAMLVHGASRLLTFNAKDFQRFEPLIQVVTP